MKYPVHNFHLSFLARSLFQFIPQIIAKRQKIIRLGCHFSIDLYDSKSQNDGDALLGIAFLEGVCSHEDGGAISLVEASPFNIEQTVNIAAHELGHK